MENQNTGQKETPVNGHLGTPKNLGLEVAELRSAASGV